MPIALAASVWACGSDASGGADAPKQNQLTDAGTDVPGGGNGGGGGDGGASPSPSNVQTASVSGLMGVGLVLRTAAGAVVTVTADGQIQLAQPVTVGAGEVLEVVTQPTSPSQTCTAKVIGTSIAVSCETNRFLLGGEVVGLAGTGLVLASATGESLTIGASGSFAFAERVRDLASYEVSIAAQPTKPRQTCALEHPAGSIVGTDVDSVVVRCTTERFHVSGQVVGLLGSGLTLALEGVETEAIVGTGSVPFAFSASVPDGSAYAVTVSAQPRSPEQRCVVVRGAGTVDGDVINVSVVCGALGGLRVSEVGSCYFADTACWLELHNAGSAAEDLSYYQLRTTAVRTGLSTDYSASRSFSLPSTIILPGGYVVVRAASTNALPDGGGVVHVASDGFKPWWNSSGYAELSTNGVSVDFVRFGLSTESAAPGMWGGDGSAPLLPSSGFDYGRSIARSASVGDADRASDWTLRAFATPGGPNDVTSDADVDEDGVPDSAEVSGGRFAGLDLYAMGARLGRRDMFVEIDRMDSSDPAVVPRREALDSVVRAFAAQQIAVHFDAGNLFSPSFDPANYNLGGGNVVPFAQAVGIGEDDQGIADIYDYKAQHMAPARRSLFYYQLFGWSQNKDGSGGSSGIGERPGNDSIITLGGFGLKLTSDAHRNAIANYQAATMMHELGHNLGLLHGGGDDFNRKPNYVSVMNYLYSPLGLPTIGNNEGDRYYLQRCSFLNIAQLTNPPTGSPNTFVLDYSHGRGGDIVESSVSEAEGLGRMESQHVDFNCNGKSDAPYERDLNGDARKDLLQDYDDWQNLDFVFRRTYAGSENGPSLFSWYEPEQREDLFTDDVQPVSDEPCPALPVVTL